MLLRKTLQFGLATGIPALINFGALSLYTHLLPPSQYGQVALVLASVTVVNALLFQWLRSSTRRYVVAWSDRRDEFLGTVAKAYLILAGIAVAGAVVATFVLHERPLGSLLWLGVAILLGQTWFELNQDLVLMEHRADRYGGLAFSRALVAIIVGGGLTVGGLGALGPLIGMAAGFAVPGLWSWFGVWRNGAGTRVAASALMEKLVGYGVPLSASFALQFVLDSSDRLLLGALAGTAAVGSYAVAYDLAQQALFLLMMAVNLAAYPVIVRHLEHGGIQAAREHLRQQGVLLLAIGVPAAVGLSVLASPLTELVFGERYRASATSLLPIICLGIILGGFKAFYVDLAFQLSHRTAWLVRIALPSAALNVALNLFWIPAYGATGAAWATVVAFALGLTLSALWGRRFFPLEWPWRDWLGVVVASAVMGLALWPLRESHGVRDILVGGLAAVLAYGATIVVLNVGGARAWLRELLRTRRRVTQ